MRLEDFHKSIEAFREDVLSSSKEYLKLLKVIGNNQNYNFHSQLSIYGKRPNAIYCLPYKSWEKSYARKVKYGEKGIPILKGYGNNQKIDHEFDIGQTFYFKNSKEFIQRTFDLDAFNEAMNDLTDNNSVAKKDYEEISFYEKKLETFIKSLPSSEDERYDFNEFFRLSVSYAIAARRGEEYPVEEEFLEENLARLNKRNLHIFGECVSGVSKVIINASLRKMSEKNKEEMVVNYHQKEEKEKDDDQQQRREMDAAQRMRRYGRASNEDERHNGGRAVGGRGVHGGISQSSMGDHETGLSSSDTWGGSVVSLAGSLSFQGSSETYQRDSIQSDRVLAERERENDESLGYSQRNRSTLSSDAISIEGDYDQGSNRELKGTEEVSFFNSLKTVANYDNSDKKYAIKVGEEFIFIGDKEIKDFNISLISSGKIYIDGEKIPLYAGSSFEESKKIDRLIDSGNYLVRKVKDYLKDPNSLENIPIKNLKELKIEDYYPGLEVKYKDVVYVIENNDFLNDSMSTLTLKEKNEKIYNGVSYGITNTLFYTEKRPIEGLYAKQEDLEKYRQTIPKIVVNYHNSKKEENKKVENFVITKGFHGENLTPSERLNYNVEAISMLNRIERKERELDIAAQEVLAKYVGWGGLAEVFDESEDGQWRVAREFLKKELTTSEYRSAAESTLTAFYTPKIVVDAIYQGLEKLGFKEGRILEPSMGIGNFLGSIPESMKNSSLSGVEIDSVSGRIAKLLYPQADIQVRGFEETKFADNSFDVVLGNVPFGDFKVNDREYNDQNFLIHDYFFAKALDKVKEGGIVAFITSSGTMDKKDRSVRRYLSERADLIAAIRLPNSTFKGVAGTIVTSDILFLRKGKEKELHKDWIDLQFNKDGYLLNQYFVDYPEMILGDLKEVSGRFGSMVVCSEKKDISLKELLDGAIENIAKQAEVLEENKTVVNYHNFEKQEDPVVNYHHEEAKNFSYTIVDNEIFYVEDGELIKQELSEKNEERIREYIQLSYALRKVIKYQTEDRTDQEIQSAQEKLNEIYDRFVKKFKNINDIGNERVLREDSNYPLVSSIEILKEDGRTFVAKGDIFFKRTISQSKPLTKVDTSLEALVLSISEKAIVDFDYMSNLTGKKRKTLIDELKGEIFLDISEKNSWLNRKISFEKEDEALPFYCSEDRNSIFQYVSKDEYLSGDIREKISILDSFIERIKQHKRMNQDGSEEEKKTINQELEKLHYQKEELQRVLPKDLEPSEINVRLGATWIKPSYIRQFIFELTKPSYYAMQYIHVNFSEPTGEWNVEGKSKGQGNALAEMSYGTSRANAFKLIEDALNLRETRVYDYIQEDDGSKTAILNKKETMLALQKQELIKEEFKNWIFKDSERRRELCKLYNQKFNSIRNREYDGKNLRFEGMAENIQLRKHQRNAIARVLYGGNALLAHVVGAGKTYEMVASAMESKRLGLCNKSLFVVPNHLTGQMGREFMQLYPGANILVADKKDFEPKNRKRFIGRIATGEYDAVIIGHSQFEKIPMSKEFQEQHIQEQIDDITEFIQEYKQDHNKRFTVKELMKFQKKLKTKLEKLNDDFKKDDVLSFEELGVDRLFIDEAHNYKNLFLHTKMRNVAGIGQSEAFKSSDMFMKCRYMDQKTNNKGVIFATGTPVSNSMTELYTMQRYLQYEVLKEKNLEHFDAWASTFGETQSALELSPEGSGYRMKTRFSRFYNLPELMGIFKEVADIQTADMLSLPTPEAEFHVIKTQPSKVQKEFLQVLAERAEDVRNKKVDPEEDNMLRITSDGKKLALDQRLMNPLLPDEENSKVNSCVENVYKLWKVNEERRSTQLIFSDMATPKSDGEFNIYDDIKEKLISKGIPEDEIAFIHEANNDKQKEELFANVRNGRIRILMGSTQKMGAGTNVQDKLIALHDLDVPWRPSDLEQRSGRIIRQGNENEKVEIYRYITENTFDAYLWQTIENKQKFISQIMTSKTPVRVAEDSDESCLSYAEIKALATGDPRIKEKMELDNDVAKLKMLEANYKANKYRLEEQVERKIPESISWTERIIQELEEDIRSIEPKSLSEDSFNAIELGGKMFYEKKEAGIRLLEEIKKHKTTDSIVIGKYRGFTLEINYNFHSNEYNFTLTGKQKHLGRFGNSSDGNITRLDNVLDRISEEKAEMLERLNNLKQQLATAKEEVEKPFEKEEELTQKLARLAIVNSELDLGNQNYEEEEQLSEEDITRLKQKMLDFVNGDFKEEEKLSLEEFEEIYLENLKNIPLKVSNTPDGKHELSFAVNLPEMKMMRYIDDREYEVIDWKEKKGNIKDAMQALETFLESGQSRCLRINQAKAYEVLGLKMDVDGNLYNPAEKNL